MRMKRCRKTEKNRQLYEEYVKKVTPTHSLPANMVKAFLVGGLICVSGQAVTEWALAAGMDEKTDWNLVFHCLDLSECPDYGYEPLSTAGKMGRSRHPCADHRICQFCGGTGSGIPERRTGIWNRKQDIYHSGTGDTLWGADLMGVGTDTVRGRKVVADGDRETEYSVGKAGLCGKLGIGCWKKRGGKVHWLLSLMKLRRMISWDRITGKKQRVCCNRRRRGWQSKKQDAARKIYESSSRGICWHSPSLLPSGSANWSVQCTEYSGRVLRWVKH